MSTINNNKGLYYELGVMAYNVHQKNDMFNTLHTITGIDYDYTENFNHLLKNAMDVCILDIDVFSDGFRNEHSNHMSYVAKFSDEEDVAKYDKEMEDILDELIKEMVFD